ncbi:MAG: SPOR domain-containing protein [Candidatus Sumerlaeaceae bacterium]|nr:SPOR domain-containing protein [Candidatus Sumerlaeaceae bacterium]
MSNHLTHASSYGYFIMQGRVDSRSAGNGRLNKLGKKGIQSLKLRMLAAAVLLFVTVPAVAERLYTDTFVGGNGTRPGIWAPAANEAPPLWTLQNSELVSGNVQGQPGGVSYALINTKEAADWTDYFIQADFWNPEPLGGALIVGRWQDPQNYYEGGAFSEGGKRYLKIDRIKDGKRETLVRQDESGTFRFPAIENMPGSSSRIVMRMIFVGNEIGLFLDKAGLIRTTDQTFSKGRAGLGASGTSIHFDNVIVDNNYRSVFVPSAVNPVVAQATPSAGAAPTPAAPAPVAAVPAAQLPAVAPTTPAIGGATGRYQVVVASGLDQQVALGMQRSLQADGYSPVEVADVGGRFMVLVGNFEDQRQAEACMADLKNSKGYQPERVQSAADRSGVRSVATAEAGKFYRVLVTSLPTREDADKARDSLVADDFIGAEVLVQDNAFQVVLGKFATRQEADRLVQQLRGSGYAVASIIETVETASPEQEKIATADIPEAFRTLRPDLLKQALALYELSQRVGQASADEVIQLRTLLRESSPEVRQAVVAARTKEQTRRENAARMAAIFDEYGKLYLAAKWDEAAKKLEEARAVDPSDPRIPVKEQQLARIRAGEVGVATLPAAQQAGDQKASLLANARRYETEGQLTLALSMYEQLRSLDAGNTEAATKIAELQRRIEERRQTQTASGLSPTVLYLIYGVVAVVVIGFLVLAYMLYQNRRTEQKLVATVSALAERPGVAQQPAAPGAAAPATPSPGRGRAKKPAVAPAAPTAPAGASSALFGGSMLGSTSFGSLDTQPMDEPVAQPAENVFTPEIEAKIEQRPAGEPDVIAFDDVPAPPARAKAPTVSAVGDTLNFDALELAPSAPSSSSAPPALDLPPLPESVVPPKPAAPKEPSVEDLVPHGKPAAPAPPGLLDLEALTVTPPEARVEDIPAAPPTIDLGLPPEGALELPELSITETVVPGLADSTPLEPSVPPAVASAPREAFESTAVVPPPAAPPTPAESPAPAAAAAGPVADGFYYKQDFDDETPGRPPRNWTGEYDYASLTVDTEAAVPGSKACLKFEKKTGSGSANYVCAFPKASGRVIVEFDIRCDEKNKYLLGFYIERDEDFKQSVHTIIHRLDSKSQPSLRLQGEPVPYELGTWRHVKYDLNLLAGIVSAYVDGTQVVKEAKLPTIPPYVNTLSIRDNLATTGVFYLDNIMIYKG